MLDQIYTSSKVADMLESNKRTIQQLCRNGKLKGHKKLGKWFVLHSDIVKYLKSKK